MNLRVLIYFISIVSLSFLIGFFEYFIDFSTFYWPFYVGLMILLIVHVFSLMFYSSLIGYPSKKLTNGLFVSSLCGGTLIILLIFSFSGFSGGVSEWNEIYKKIIFLTRLIIILSIAISFIIDAFFNKETRNLKKWRIALGSIVFYGITYVFSYDVALFLSMIEGISSGW